MTMKRFFSSAAALLLLLCLLCVFAFAETAPMLEINPASPIFPEGSTASWSCTVSDGSGDFYDYHWYIVYGGTVYDTWDFDNLASMPWYAFGDPETEFGIGAMENRYFITGIRKGLDGAEIFCTAENSLGKVTSERAVIRVTDSDEPLPPENLGMPAFYSVEQDSELVLTCKATKAPSASGGLHHLWYRSSTGSLRDIQAVNRGSETNATLKVDTSEPGITTYYCGVCTDGGKYENNFSFTGAITVEVLEKEKIQEITALEEPAKLVYKVGEYPDLAGLKLRVITNKGFFDLTDLSEVSAEPAPFDKDGKQTMLVTYEGKTLEIEVEVKALDPVKPVIEVQPKGGDFIIGEGTPKLTVKASVTDEGELTYTWYSCTNGNKASLRPISYAAEDSMTLPQTEGTVFYCVYVWNTLNGLQSEAAVSDLVPVSFAKAEEEKPEEKPEEPGKAEAASDVPEKVEEFITAGENGEEAAPEEIQPEPIPEKTKKKNGSGALIAILLSVVLLALGGGTALIVLFVKKDKAEKRAEAERAAAARRPAPASDAKPAARPAAPRSPDLDETLVLPADAFENKTPAESDELDLTRILQEFGSASEEHETPENEA